MNVPDYIPLLRKGPGETPADGGCLMQVANWFADPTTWTDYEGGCVHRMLASTAMAINDCVPQQKRQKLALLIPRFINTRKYETDPKVAIGLAKWRMENILDWGLLLWPPEEYGYEYLVAMLDEFDRLSGRTEKVEITEAQWREVKELVSQ